MQVRLYLYTVKMCVDLYPETGGGLSSSHIIFQEKPMSSDAFFYFLLNSQNKVSTSFFLIQSDANGKTLL